MSSLNHDSPLRVVLARRHSVHEIRKANVQTLLCESDTPDLSDLEPSRPEPSPLYHLIPEILYKIFTFIRDSDEIRDWRQQYPFRVAAAKWNWITVSHVCRYWRNSALDFSLLWSHLINFSDIEKSKVFLERSKGSPLKVCFWSGVGLGESNNIIQAKKYDCLIEALLHMERISYLDLFICITPFQIDVRDNFQRLLSRYSPNLHTIKFQVIISLGLSSNSLELPLRIPENTPTLKRLSLASFSWPANMPLPANLLELDLSSITGVSPHMFFTALRSSLDLETLVISNVRWTAEPSMDETVIYLQRLRSFIITFDEDSTGVNKKLLKLLRTPDTANWSFSCTVDHWESLFSANCFEFIRNGRDTLTCVEEKILITPIGCSIWSINTIGGNRGVYLITRDLKISFREPMPTIESLANVTSLITTNQWRRTEKINLSLHLMPEIIDEEHWCNFFLSLSAIRDFNIDIEENGDADQVDEDLRTNTEHILEILLSGKGTTLPVVVSDGVTICPDLRRFSVVIRGAPTKNLASFIRRGLQSRIQIGLGLDSFSIHTKDRRRIPELEALSDLVKYFSYTCGRTRRILDGSYFNDYYDIYLEDEFEDDYLDDYLEEPPDWTPPVSDDEAQVDSEEDPLDIEEELQSELELVENPWEIEEELELEVEPEPERIVRRRSI